MSGFKFTDYNEYPSSVVYYAPPKVVLCDRCDGRTRKFNCPHCQDTGMAAIPICELIKMVIDNVGEYTYV